MAEDVKNKQPSPERTAPIAHFQLPHWKEFGVLLVAWLALFHFFGNSTLGYVNTPSLFGWWQWTTSRAGDQDHAYLMPFIVVGLIYYRRSELALVPKQVWWPAFLVVGMALGIHAVGFLVQQARISVVAFFLGVYALTGLMWGWRWMVATFLAFTLLVFCIPLGTGVEPLTFPLRLLATTVTAVFCQTALGIDVVQRGNQLFDAGGQFQYEVAAACSGIQSLTFITAFAIIYGYLNFSKSPWRLGVLLLSGIPMAVLANVVRLIMIIIAAEAFGQKAGDMVHQHWFFSLVPYIPAIGGLLLVGRWLRISNATPDAGTDALVGKAQEA